MRTPVTHLLRMVGVALLLLTAAWILGGVAFAAPLPQVVPTASPTAPLAEPTASPTAPLAEPTSQPTGTVTAPTASPTAPRSPTPIRTPTVPPYTAKPPGPAPTIIYTDTAITDTTGLWIGELKRGATLRVGPGTNFAYGRYWPRGRRVLVYRTVTALNGQAWYQVGHYPDPNLYISASLVTAVAPLAPAAIRHTDRWVDVNLTQQTVTAYDGDLPVMVDLASTGKPGHETDVGSWRIYWRLPAQDMSGGGKGPSDRFYNLKSVPWVQYFHTSGEGLHGTYWHDNFGRPMSHGCVNLTDQTALWLYNWAQLGTFVEVHY